MAQHTLTTARTTEQVEALPEPILTFRAETTDFARMSVRDGAIVTSADGDTFIGEIDEVDEWDGVIRVRLY